MGKKWTAIAIALFMIMMIVPGCQTGETIDRPLTVIFFSNFSPTFQNKIKSEIASFLPNSVPFKIIVYPAVQEKLIVELSARDGDLYIADDALIKNYLSVNGITPLDSLGKQSKLTNLNQYYTKNEDTNETHLYGIPITNQSYVFHELGIHLKSNLIAILPQFSKRKKDSFEILKVLLKQD
jgi:hypothetical protein